MKTIPQAFDDFRRSIELTEKQRQAASDQQNRVRAVVRVLDGYQRDFLTGSYKRRTCLRPLDDIDFFVELDGARGWWDKPQEGASDVLQRVRQVLDKAWLSKDKPKLQMRSLNVEFAGTGIGYDVVPAFKAACGGYWIPDRNAGWIRSDPTVHEQKLTEANTRTAGRLVPLIKMVKQWRKELKRQGRPVPFSGFHLETLAVRRHQGFFPVGLSGDLADDLVGLMRHIADHIAEPCPDPAGLGPDLNLGMDGPAARAICAEALEFVSEASKARKQGDDETAHRNWGNLVGSGYAFR